MKLNLIEWNRVVEALRIARAVSQAEREKCPLADGRKHYVMAQNFGELADKIEAEERS